jgi:hypothetical protein
MQNDNEMNLQLRSEILHIALNLENIVNELLLALLLIDNPKRKALSNKSGNLSFRNKLDLLFDLDVLVSDEHQKLLLLMEFRNQVLHNIECNSFQNAVKLLGGDKEKRLLQFANEDNIGDQEYQYQGSFRNLNIECLEILRAKFDDRMRQIENRRKILVRLTESPIVFINRYFDILKKVMLICEEHFSEIPEVTKLINQINKTVSDDIESLLTSDEFAQIQTELKELNTPEKIKALFIKR